jgi:hypothetical protein
MAIERSIKRKGRQARSGGAARDADSFVGMAAHCSIAAMERQGVSPASASAAAMGRNFKAGVSYFANTDFAAS